MGRRTLLIIASIMVAAAGTALIWLYVRSADERAQAGIEQVTVLRAKLPIDVGTSVALIPPEAIEQAQVPKKSLPENAISSLAGLAGRTVTAPIFPGQYLITSQFGGTGQLSGLDPARMGVAVPMDDPNRVAGLLQPGSQVAVYFVQLKQGDTTGTSGSGQVSLLMPTVKVLAIGGTTAALGPDGVPLKVGTQSGVPTTVVTLEATGRDAARIILASKTGLLYFTLLGQNIKGADGDNVDSGALLRRSA